MTSYGAVSVGAAAASYRVGSGARSSILIQNVHATQDLYLGTDENVLTTTGFKVPPGQSVRLTHRGPLFAIASGAATDTRFIEESI